uniref:Uncharacterized protein n=1 Tax=Oryza brachyantha TaxID=4533 RepID=J3LW19_ORYBR
STVHDDSRRTTDGEPQIAASSSSRGGAGCKSKTRAESPGVIWPTHINEREESEFKHRLIGALSKPFSQEEYDKLYGMPSIRNPPMKERQTRSGVKAYKCPHGIGKSYFDHYPDLAEQVENTSCSNRLALLRGLFFWLENVAHEHQFRPWSNDNKCLKVI